MDKMSEEIMEVVKDCGLFILNADRRKSHIVSKEGHANFVTEYDKKVQNMLKTELLRLLPGSVFIGEEETPGTSNTIPENGYAFIVDPIDGTTNFIKDYKASCISVALIKNGKQYIGIVYNPYLDEMFYAKEGEGAYLNGVRIHVSDKTLAEGLVAFGTSPYYDGLRDKTFEMAKYYFDRSMDIRRSGSAALDLCTVACGRTELFFEMRLQPWDFAAGGLIVQEAGGKVTTVEGGELKLDSASSIIAWNGQDIL